MKHVRAKPSRMCAPIPNPDTAPNLTLFPKPDTAPNLTLFLNLNIVPKPLRMCVPIPNPDMAPNLTLFPNPNTAPNQPLLLGPGEKPCENSNSSFLHKSIYI